MSHLQLVQEAAPIFKANADGGVYLITSSVAVSLPKIESADSSSNRVIFREFRLWEVASHIQ